MATMEAQASGINATADLRGSSNKVGGKYCVYGIDREESAYESAKWTRVLTMEEEYETA